MDQWNQGRRDKQVVFEGEDRRQGDRRRRFRRTEDRVADLTIKIVIFVIGLMAYGLFNTVKGML